MVPFPLLIPSTYGLGTAGLGFLGSWSMGPTSTCCLCCALLLRWKVRSIPLSNRYSNLCISCLPSMLRVEAERNRRRKHEQGKGVGTPEPAPTDQWPVPCCWNARFVLPFNFNLGFPIPSLSLLSSHLLNFHLLTPMSPTLLLSLLLSHSLSRLCLSATNHFAVEPYFAEPSLSPYTQPPLLIFAATQPRRSTSSSPTRCRRNPTLHSYRRLWKKKSVSRKPTDRTDKNSVGGNFLCSDGR